MKIIRTISEMQQQSAAWHREGYTVGFVPTMGYLHEGHLSLVRKALENADVVVVSIFVNPTQFSPNEDYETYPRDFAHDEGRCRELGVDAVFYPDREEMYPDDFSTWVNENALSKLLCGRSRPGHFDGVATVVAKLFNAVLPDFAVFGQKDAQQACIIMRMVRDLNFPVRILLGPIVREEDGLALSSRNEYLSSDERRRALAISRGLQNAREAFENGQRSVVELQRLVTTELKPTADQVDYVDVVSRADLRPLETVDEPAFIAVAAYFGEARLIDNVFLDP